ncbi:N-acetylmuramoyl-L-alanine amidase [Thioalkalivibrio sulfidiphilus]|uniref:N-acetylmuramoyl-L-alanine amidase AmiC n=1 Tax=Thioalkalivibrio sulfidiphilus (strain HL-EbGR7) TaxID=396588 RepID=B8GNC4_THISH|nr:N-acetylmuramoyl-L-alanine amidase [Thioalkalivibrio sulfidiphilus HL-EbGr7]
MAREPEIHRESVVSQSNQGYPRRRFLLELLRASGMTAASVMAPGVLLAAGRHHQVQGIRLSAHEGQTRLVFDLTGPVEHSLFTLTDPHRVVIDIQGASARDLVVPSVPDSVVSRLRYAPRNNTDLRVVLDLRAQANPRSFVLRPGEGAGHRLVVDLQRQGSALVSAPAPQPQQPIRSMDQPAPRLREVVVAIDAGHGGRDPGAVGQGGTREKDVVLAIAQRLERLVAREPGMKPVMIRTGDYFLPLRDRIRRARDQRADVFISIHADAAPDRRVQGSSVYILSQGGATSEAARWLAERENAADLVGGVKLDDKDDVLASVLLDLSQTGTIEASATLADSLIGDLHRVGKVRSRRVERAGFAVLKSPDIPSVLVEAAFISNPAEERKLRTPAFQQSLAEALMGGLRSYFSNHAPPGTILAETRRGRHVIQSGETLSTIASRYQVSLNELRQHNNLSNDRISAGQVLVIPRRDS